MVSCALIQPFRKHLLHHLLFGPWGRGIKRVSSWSQESNVGETAVSNDSHQFPGTPRTGPLAPVAGGHFWPGVPLLHLPGRWWDFLAGVPGLGVLQDLTLT